MALDKIQVIYENLIVAGGVAISADAVNTSFPAVNAVHQDLFLPFAGPTTGDDDVYLQVDFGSTPTTPIEGVVAVGTNLKDTATRRFRTSANSNMSSATGDSGNGSAFDVTLDRFGYQGPAGRDVIWLPGSDVKARYLRTEFDNDGTSDIRVAHLVAGPVWEPSNRLGLTWRRSPKYPSARAVRHLDLTWKTIPADDADEFEAMVSYLAGVGRVYLVLQKERAEAWHLTAMLGTFGEPVLTPIEDRYQLNVPFDEADW